MVGKEEQEIQVSLGEGIIFHTTQGMQYAGYLALPKHRDTGQCPERLIFFIDFGLAGPATIIVNNQRLSTLGYLSSRAFAIFKHAAGVVFDCFIADYTTHLLLFRVAQIQTAAICSQKVRRAFHNSLEQAGQIVRSCDLQHGGLEGGQLFSPAG